MYLKFLSTLIKVKESIVDERPSLPEVRKNEASTKAVKIYAPRT